MVGRKYGNLTVLELVETKPRTRWMCVCDCGNRKVSMAFQLKNGKSNSCGCKTSQRISEASKTHGMSGTPTAQSWNHLKQRTTNPNNDRWHDYGGRGITLCEKWQTFEGFFDDMGERPDGTTIGRIDNEKGYSKDNCRWETKEQQYTNMRSNHCIEHNGEIKTITEWAKIKDMPLTRLSTRIRRGWTIERALTEGLQTGNNQYNMISALRADEWGNI